MTAVGIGQQRSQEVGLGVESLPGQKYLRFIPNIFRYPKLVTLRGSYENFRHCETKSFRRQIVNPPSLIPNIFRYPKLKKH